jgi:hypothetical protein
MTTARPEIVTIEVKLSPELEARLTAEAEARGVSLAKLAQIVLEQALSGHRGSDGKLTVEEFHSMSTALAAGSETLPNLPTDSFSRESFYQDRQ